MTLKAWLITALTATLASASPSNLPFVINTWGGAFTAATDAAYLALIKSNTTSALDAVEIGCATCERNQCDTTVGYGGSPDERCETTLDAMIMDGATMNVGAVAGMRRVRDAIAVARAVLEHTTHSMLSGDLATLFAEENGFKVENLTTPDSAKACEAWRRDKCQPNYRVNVKPDPQESCGPYEPVSAAAGGTQHRLSDKRQSPQEAIEAIGHDTISQIVIHRDGSMASGTSTNGANHKIPGRVGDGPIAGSGSYVDDAVGGCGATGEGDIMMRFLPCYQALESMRHGMSPLQAAEDAVKRMAKRYPKIQCGIVVVDNKGNHGGAGNGWTFTYSYRGGSMNETKVVTVPPVQG